MGDTEFELHWIDYTIVLIYFIGIVAHGIYVSRKSGDGADDYFLAGRSLPWYLIGFSLFASNMSGSSFVGLMGGAYDNGVVIFNYEWTAALVIGVPPFVVKEVLGLWTQSGLPEIHYTVMSSIMMALGIVLHLGISAMTRRKEKENIEDLIWSMEGAIQHVSTWEHPLWKNLTPWAGLLTIATTGFIIWFW